MATVVMPQLGESVTEGTILQWMKQPGDPVRLDDSLCEIETEKVTAELPSPFEGAMGEIYVAEGETVEVGARLCEVAEAGVISAPVPAASPETESEAPALSGNGWTGGPMAIPPEEREEPKPTPPATVGAQPSTGVVESPVAVVRPLAAAVAADRSGFFSPAVLRLAQERGVDLAKVSGTGTGGRVTRKDVEAHVSGGGPSRNAPAEPPESKPATNEAPATAPGSTTGTPVVLSATRKTIANRLTKSNLEAPQAWTMVEADVSGVVRRREEERERFAQQGIQLTLLPYMVAAVCTALREVPGLNARWDGEQLLRFDQLNVGIAVAAESGLVVPVIHDAGSLSLEGLARGIADLAERARSRRLKLADIEGGTFTVNNTGAFGSIASKPIVNHPEVGIVTFERAVQRPVVVNDGIAIRWMANLCLSFDHRALDGSEAGRFLAVLKAALEEA